MQLYELDILLNNIQFSYKQNWEMTRYISYIIAQCNSKKNLKLTDILKFSWENEHKSTTVTNADIERLTEKMNNILNNKQK